MRIGSFTEKGTPAWELLLLPQHLPCILKKREKYSDLIDLSADIIYVKLNIFDVSEAVELPS